MRRLALMFRFWKAYYQAARAAGLVQPMHALWDGFRLMRRAQRDRWRNLCITPDGVVYRVGIDRGVAVPDVTVVRSATWDVDSGTIIEEKSA